MGAASDPFLRGRRTLRDQHPSRSSRKRALGLRPSLLHYFEPGGWGKSSGKPGCVHGVSAAHVGRLRSCVLAEIRASRISEGGRKSGGGSDFKKSAIEDRFVYPVFFDARRIRTSS